MSDDKGKYGEDSGLLETVKYRFLNRDGAGVIVERLSQPEMTRLFDWFVHESGCRSGNLFLECAPLFDTALETQAEAPISPPVDKSLEYSDGFEQEESGASQPATHCEENTTVSLAYGFFGAGLLWGVKYQRYAVDSSRSPLPVERSICDFLSQIFEAKPGSFSADADRLSASGAPSAAQLTFELVDLVPALDLVIRAGYRLCCTRYVDSLDAGGYGSHLRYLFCLGLLASGLSVPGRLAESR